MANKGIFMKYRIHKTDGSRVDPDACYFVLRLDTDRAARRAARVYAGACGNDELALDLETCVNELELPSCGCVNEHCEHIRRSPSIWRHGQLEDPMPTF